MLHKQHKSKKLQLELRIFPLFFSFFAQNSLSSLKEKLKEILFL